MTWQLVLDGLRDLFGIDVDPEDRSALQISVRSLGVFLAALVMVRLGAKRFLARKTAFDIVLAFILASTLARTINGSAPYVPTLVAGFVLVFFHKAVGWIGFRFDPIGRLVKGQSDVILQNGQPVEAGIRKNLLGQRDIAEELRLHGVADRSEVREARVERSGDVSVLRKEP